MKKKEAQQRWVNKRFVTSISPIIDEILKKRTNIDSQDLSGITIGLSGPLEATLFYAHLFGVNLHDIDFSFSKFSCQFNYGSFVRVIFKQCIFDNCSLHNSKFMECKFDESRMIMHANDARFDTCSFAGTLIKPRRLGDDAGGLRSNFHRCDFSSTSFKNVQFRASKWIDCSFDGAQFEDCDLRHTKFTNSIPSISQFVRCNLTGVKFNDEPIVTPT